MSVYPSQEKAAFRELIAQLELDPKCRGLPLSSFLILPFQRITRLKLLVQVPASPPSPCPDVWTGLACVSPAADCFLQLFQVSASFLGSSFAPQILMKLLLCATQWGSQPLFPVSHSLGIRSTGTHKQEVVMAVRTVKRRAHDWGVTAWSPPVRNVK